MAVYCKSVNCNPPTPLLRFVVNFYTTCFYSVDKILTGIARRAVRKCTLKSAAIVCVQAHSLTRQVHRIDLISLDKQSVSEVSLYNYLSLPIILLTSNGRVHAFVTDAIFRLPFRLN